MTEIKQLWEILVPYKMGRKNVQVPYHQEWDAKVITISGGMTIMKLVKGVWMSPTNNTHKELMIPVRIACSEEQIREIGAMTIVHYKQEAVFITLISEKAIILHASPQTYTEKRIANNLAADKEYRAAFEEEERNLKNPQNSVDKH